MTDSYAKNTAYLLFGLAAALIFNLVLQTMVHKGPWDFSAAKAGETLADIHAHRGAFGLSAAADAVANLTTLIIATRVVFLFRARSEQLSAAAGRYLGLGPAIMLVADAIALTLAFTVRNGADGESLQQVATAIGQLWNTVTYFAFIVIDFGVLAIALILLRTAPVAGAAKSPKWLGYAGLLMPLLPLGGFLSIWNMSFAPLGLIGAVFTIVFVIGNGVGFMRNGVRG